MQCNTKFKKIYLLISEKLLEMMQFQAGGYQVTNENMCIVFRNRRWLVNIRRKDLANKSVVYRWKNLYVYSDHFTRECFMNDSRSRLTVHAVPTVFTFQSANATPRKPPTQRNAPPCNEKVPPCNDSASTSRSLIEHSYCVTQPETTATASKDTGHLHDSIVSVSVTVAFASPLLINQM